MPEEELMEKEAALAAEVERLLLEFVNSCRDSLGIHVFSATYVLNGGCQSLKRTVGTVPCG